MSTKGDQKSGAEAKVSSGNGGKSSSTANAWARPLQSKRNTAPPPGMGPPSKSAAASSQSSVSFQHRERLLHLSLTLVGQKVVLHQTNGAIVQGIFHTFTPFSSLPADQRNKFVLKEVIIQQQPSTETAIKDGITLIIPASKVVLLHAVGIAAGLRDSNKMNGDSNAGEAAPSKGGFATDTQISGSGAGGKANDLVAAGNAWTTGGNSNGNGNYRNQALGAGGNSMGQPMNSRAAALAGNKGDSAANNQQGGSATASAATGGKITGSIGQWDQFQANKELFNVNASFDENLYTTQLDKSQIDKKKMKEAERIAKEIENTMTKNIHLAEERGFKVETDFDEEDLYSGVLTKDGKQRHEKVTITKKSAKEKEAKNVGNASKSNSSSTSAAPRKIMNYAAAAAKADASKNKNAPPGFSGNGPTSTTKGNDDEEKKPVVTPEKNAKEDAKVTQKSVPSKDSKSAAKVVDEKTETSKKSEKDKSSAKDNKASKESYSATPKPSRNETDKKLEAKDKATEKKAEKKDSKKSTKLNANAKSFAFNPSAKSFTPTFGSSATNNPPPQPHQPAAAADPNMQMYGGGHPMQHPHYLQSGPMGQPGMMPIMNPQYSGMSYPSSYQPMSQMQHQAPHVQAQATPSAPNSGNAPTPTPGGGPSNANANDDEDASQTGGQQQQPQRSQQQQSDQSVHSQGPPQQQQIPTSYNVPPNAYFQPGMGMPRPGYPQFVAGPQLGRPGVPPYGIYPMQPGGMPQNIQMRGPNATPYYPGPNGPMPYPPGAHMGYPMMDDGGRGRGGRSSNGGRGGRGRGGRSGRGGRGRSNYNNNNPNSGKNSQQHYNHHQSQQQQPSVPQQQGQPGNSSNKSD